MDWQPIETAPKDGTRVLLWVRDSLDAFGLPVVAYWDGAPGWELGGHEFYDCYERNGFEKSANPTYWAPIEPPKPLDTEGEG